MYLFNYLIIVLIREAWPIEWVIDRFLFGAGRQGSIYSGDNREPSFLFQRISITIQRLNSILLHNSFSSDEEWPLQLFVLLFTALHVMQTRYSEENSVCPSVTRVDCDKTVERSVQIYIPFERTFILVFWEEEWLVGGDPFYLKFWVNRPPLERNRRFLTNNRS